MKEKKDNLPLQVTANKPAATFGAELAARISTISGKVGGDSALARLCEVSPSVIGKWTRGDSEPTASNLVALARAGGFTVEWLATGEGPRTPSDVMNAEGYAFVPLYDVGASAGQGAFAEERPSGEALAFRQSWLSTHIGASARRLALINVRGDSMEPLLRNGDVIMINRDETVVTNAIYVFFMDGFLFVKRLEMRLGGIWAVSENPSSKETFPLPPFKEFEERSRVVGRVVWVGRRL